MEKLPLLVIGKSKNPRSFKGTKSLPVWYEANSKAWITQQLFEGYVRKLDPKFECYKEFKRAVSFPPAAPHGAVLGQSEEVHCGLVFSHKHPCRCMEDSVNQ
ncbi:hypothetical protein V5799_010522 [Amblyomma americanum]|uniref:DDE-1 domain-containing protein n=1 Tax=Amblyomma americanum TaxID=6943 RepID=A0AAQ4EJS4_AMBAM